jgi:hypothetical protein
MILENSTFLVGSKDSYFFHIAICLRGFKNFEAVIPGFGPNGSYTGFTEGQTRAE